jgi:Holliday junction resolvase
MSNRKGEDLARAVKAQLEQDGYFAVKSSASRTPADVVAIKRGEVLLVQCKTDGRIGPKERLDLIGLAIRTGGIPLLAWWHKEGRKARQVRFAHVGSVSPPLYVPWSADHGTEAG